MKKRFLGAVLAAALMVVSTAGVFAAGSKTAVPTVTGESAGKYVISEEKDEKIVFATLEKENPVVVDTIIQMNKGELKLKDLVEAITANLEEMAPTMTEEQVEELKEELKEKELVTRVFDLAPVDGGVVTEEGKYRVTLSVPELTDAMKDKNVKVLHFSTVRTLWEVIEPGEVDFENKELTADFEDLSPVAIIVDELEETEEAK